MRGKQKEEMESGAQFSGCRKYRYALWRIWDDSKPLVMFIGLNPSTADETEPDPTIKSVTRICKHNGFGGFFMMNCFAYVTSKPELLQFDPMHDEKNNDYLMEVARQCQDVVFAWGNFKVITHNRRDKELAEMFPNAKALHINKNGSPKHPLYCKSETTLIKFNP